MHRDAQNHLYISNILFFIYAFKKLMEKSLRVKQPIKREVFTHDIQQSTYLFVVASFCAFCHVCSDNYQP